MGVSNDNGREVHVDRKQSYTCTRMRDTWNNMHKGVVLFVRNILLSRNVIAPPLVRLQSLRTAVTRGVFNNAACHPIALCWHLTTS